MSSTIETIETTPSDISLWLQNKLGNLNDTWSSGSISMQLNQEILSSIKTDFPNLQSKLKLKFMMSFFYFPQGKMEEFKTGLEEVLQVAQVDSDPWVSMLAHIMMTLPSTGTLNTIIFENEQDKKIFSALVEDIQKLVQNQNEMNLLPLEFKYLSKSVLENIIGHLPEPPKHFTLKKEPKAAALRAKLLQKSLDAASLNESQAPTVAIRSRGMPRKMNDQTPLRGIPRQVPTTGFQPVVNNSKSRPRNPSLKKESGIKLLRINEQPLTHSQAKKMKVEQQKDAIAQKNVGQGPSIPDYAAGLPVPETASTYASSSSTACLLFQPSAATSSKAPTFPMVPIAMQTEVNQVQPRPQTYDLTREQVLMAQKLFSTANKVTRQDKSMILGFIAGSRENPSPQLGDVVTIKLSEYQEMVKLDPNEQEVPKIVETHFQMNYTTGEWKLINRCRDIVPT